MEIIKLSHVISEVAELFERARADDLIVKLEDGSEFLLVAIDDVDREISQTRDNTKLMAFLEARSRLTESVPLDEVRRRLGL